jgi:hypothetical protein
LTLQINGQTQQIKARDVKKNWETQAPIKSCSTRSMKKQCKKKESKKTENFLLHT